MALIKRFFSDTNAATSLEYALIAAGLSIAIVTVVVTLGSALGTKYDGIATAVK